MSEQTLTIGVIFGSRSVEHDVSIVTATQVMKALNRAKYNVVPIYITRDGRWYTGDNLDTLRNFNVDDISELAGIKATVLSSNASYPGLITPPLTEPLGRSTLRGIDVAFPVIHGSHGEDGTIQGLFEMMNVAYVGPGVMASAIANDKAMTKTVLKAHGLPVLEKYVAFTRQEWADQRSTIMDKVEEIGFPAIVKPVTLGSSIGIARVVDTERATIHIDIAANLDSRILVEQAVQGDFIEINAAVLGNELVRASTLEMPIIEQPDEAESTAGQSEGDKPILTFKKKYMKKGGQGMKGQERVIPAPISDDLTASIKQASVDSFKAIGGRGTARIDFLVNPDAGEFWINEINTMPGSLAFYLWEPDGLSATDVCDELIQLALEAHAEKCQTTFDYKSGLIELAASRGAKGVKGKLT